MRAPLFPLLSACLLGIAATSCVPAVQLDPACMLAPSRASWSPTVAPGRIEGTVSDYEGGAPVSGLPIRVDSVRTTTTDVEGYFRFDSLPDGVHVLANDDHVYQRRVDTLTVFPHGGVRGELRLSTKRDVLHRCPIYNP